MPTPSDAPNFDSLDADPTPASEATAKPTDSWRLGHHRPWWQWNVITLFVSLFVLIWFRELAGISQTATWMTCVAVFCVWALAPAFAVELITVDGFGRNRSTAARVLAYLGSLATLVGIMAFAGIHIGIFSVLAVILMAIAVRSRPG
jgi:hypothetical protein